MPRRITCNKVLRDKNGAVVQTGRASAKLTLGEQFYLTLSVRTHKRLIRDYDTIGRSTKRAS